MAAGDAARTAAEARLGRRLGARLGRRQGTWLGRRQRLGGTARRARLSSSCRLAEFQVSSRRTSTVGRRLAELVPPTVEQCPGAVQLTTSEPTADVQRPSVVFRTAAGLAPAVTCTYFGAGDKHRFALGRHRVSCTAFDPDFGERASATCTFVIDVKGTRRAGRGIRWDVWGEGGRGGWRGDEGGGGGGGGGV